MCLHSIYIFFLLKVNYEAPLYIITACLKKKTLKYITVLYVWLTRQTSKQIKSEETLTQREVISVVDYVKIYQHLVWFEPQ